MAREFNDPELPTLFEGPAEGRRHRDGFGLTDLRMAPREALREMHYCIICHPRDKDSCSKGLRESNGSVKKNPLGIELTGCPLNEKISEAHLLKREGHGIGALAMIMVDNPLCAGTGHRICNDCMKSCIYQKQTPVNIPQIETSILSDVLHLPYGFEIYSLLARWNPLNLRRPYPLPYNGKNILVVGMGPAGYTLAHHLLNEGFGVVGIDGLRIEPLSVRMRGAKRRVPQPIKDINDITGPLDRRTILGFGGVSEYGITVRWDKNFLDINYLLLMRRKKFRLYDGIRFGGTLTLDDAWKLGFDHVAICAGAGKPTLASHEKQPAARRAPGLRFPHGSAGHRRLQGEQPGQPSAAAPGGRDRRRPDRHRHGDRDASLLRGAGGKGAGPLRPAGRQDRRRGDLGQAG